MSKKFYVTLPDPIGDALDQWAEQENNRPATLAAYLLEKAIREASDQKKIPPIRGQFFISQNNIFNLIEKNRGRLAKYGKIPEARLELIRDGKEKPTELEIARLALALEMHESFIEELVSKQSGST